MAHAYKFIFLAVFFLLFGTFCWANSQQDQAIDAALAFSAIIDHETIQAAYWAGSELLRLANDEQEWTSHIERAQSLLGKVSQRELRAIRSVPTYPGLPDDDYLLVYFEAGSSFKAKAAEIFLIHLDGGIPKVCAYSIR